MEKKDILTPTFSFLVAEGLKMIIFFNILEGEIKGQRLKWSPDRVKSKKKSISLKFHKNVL